MNWKAFCCSAIYQFSVGLEKFPCIFMVYMLNLSLKNIELINTEDQKIIHEGSAPVWRWFILTVLCQPLVLATVIIYLFFFFLQTPQKMTQCRGDKSDSQVLTGDAKSVTNISFPSIMIIMLISPGITHLCKVLIPILQMKSLRHQRLIARTEPCCNSVSTTV